MEALPESTSDIEDLATAKAVFKLVELLTENVSIELAVILLAIRLGELEERPMDISALAAVTGFPRTTVLRKLREYEKETGGLRWTASGVRRIPVIDGGKRTWSKHLKQAARVMRQYVEILSILDSSKFDRESALS